MFKLTYLKKSGHGTYMVVQWLRLHTPNAGDPGSIPNQGTRSHMLQLKILNATKTLSNKQMSIFNILFNFGFVAVYGLSPAAMRRLFIVVVSLVAEHKL